MSTAAPQYTVADLQNLSSSASYYQVAAQTDTIRTQAVVQTAQTLGMQAGLAQESQVIDQILQARAGQLDQIFNFNLVMYQNNVLPPIITQDNNAMNINFAGDTVRIGGVRYNILNQVRFVTAPPTWRNYLWMNYPEPAMPDKSLLPQNAQERTLWQNAIISGWQAGISQGVSIYQINLNRLVQDYDGMLLYKKLLVSNMISPYYVAKQDLGVTGNGSQMVVDDQNWQISTKPQLQLQTKLWHAVPLNVSSNSTQTQQ